MSRLTPIVLALCAILPLGSFAEQVTEKTAPIAGTPETSPGSPSPVEATKPISVVPLRVETAPLTTSGPKKLVYVIPVRDEIAKPVLYILRRGLKEAIEQKADAVLLDMDTPGGQLGVTFDIMEALEKFPGETLTYVNKEAMSAGAFISATTQQIWFEPHAVIGSAAPVTGEGKDIDETMRLKVVSYLRARVRAVSEGKGHRGQAVEAMIDKDFELKIGETVIKPKGELLARTATEAMQKYGEPPQVLLGAGIARDVEDLLRQKYGAGNYTTKQFQVTWSEELAQYLNKISPVLMGLGLLCLFIEFKTPGFGIFGVSGIILLALVFLSNYVAGLSGHEPIVVFGLGLLFVVVELVFFPGVAIVAVLGLAMMLGALVWAMADLWPGVPVTTAWSADAFVAPLQNLLLGLVIAAGMGVALLRYLPKGWVWDRMVVASTIGGAAQMAGVSPDAASSIGSLIGQSGLAVTMLRPSGQVEIAGQRYEAMVEVGVIDAGDRVVVCGRKNFSLVVERKTA